jgi:uncharacterized protein YndB with AHSA1/START domain
VTVDRIEREIVISAPQQRVWEVLTQPAHVSNWFGDSAEIDLRPGGKMVFGWSQYDNARHHAVVEKVDPIGFFSYRWARPSGAEPAPDNSTLVEFTLSPASQGTRLKVTETGFASLDVSEQERNTAVRENTEGWRDELGELQEYAERIAA